MNTPKSLNNYKPSKSRIDMSRNPAFGKWTVDDTNWSQKDTDIITDVLKEKPVPTSYEELLDEYESSLLTC